MINIQKNDLSNYARDVIDYKQIEVFLIDICPTMNWSREGEIDEKDDRDESVCKYQIDYFHMYTLGLPECVG